MSYLLKANELQKSFYHPIEVEVLSSVSLELCAGETIAIMGASGEGKSTLLHLLGTLEEPTGGKLLICGQTATRYNRPALRNAHIGFIFQAFHLLDDSSALENVLIPALIGRRPKAPSRIRAAELLEEVGLGERKLFATSLLSGGEKQRVAIARALMNDPEILLADEPTGNLDRETSLNIHEILIGYAKEQNKGLIVVTHDSELAQLCDRTLLLKEGRLTAPEGHSLLV
jgi:lipoprotein-releasing system ATP-binding protein